MNSAFEKLVGYSLEELRGMTCLDLTYEEDRNAYEILENELEEGTRDQFEIEKRYVRKDGGIVRVRANGSTLPALAGEPRLRVIVVEDITERKRLYDDLQRQLDRLRALLDLTHRLIAKLDVSSVVESVLAVLHQREQWEITEILLPDPSTDRLRLYGLGRTEHLSQEGRTISIDGSVAGRVYRSGQRIVFRSEELPRLFAAYDVAPWVQDLIRETGVAAGCLLPLTYSGQVLGVMFLGTKKNREFPATELDYLQEVAQFVAAALDHALRFDALSTSQERRASERN